LPARIPKPSTPPLPTIAPSLKRSAPDDDVIDLEPSSKRIKTNGQLPPNVISSPSKRRRLEEDGLLLLDGANDKLEDDVIEID
jgi:ubiquitin-like 1-activating enzyme E1 B